MNHKIKLKNSANPLLSNINDEEFIIVDTMRTHQDDEKVIIFRSGDGSDSVVIEYQEDIVRFLRFMNNEISEDELALSQERYDELYNDAKNLGLLTVNSYEDTRYSRNINLFEWFDTSSEVNPAIYQEKIENTRIIIIGVGGIGSSVAEMLARMGVRDFVLVDFDIVEESNITRQSCYVEADVGKSKVACVQNYLQKINKNVSVTIYEMKIEGVTDLEHCALYTDDKKQLVLCCADKPDTIQDWFDEFAVKYQQAYVTGNYAATAINTYTINPPHTVTSAQFFGDTVEQWVLKNRPIFTSVTAPIAFMAASLVALEAQKFITGLGYQKVFTQINVKDNTVKQWPLDVLEDTESNAE